MTADRQLIAPLAIIAIACILGAWGLFYAVTNPYPTTPTTSRPSPTRGQCLTPWYCGY